MNRFGTSNFSDAQRPYRLKKSGCSYGSRHPSRLENKTKFIIESDAAIAAPLIFAHVLGW
jgi:hypothetical protein